jgi:predicted membrane protein (TIGR00267 family)
MWLINQANFLLRLTNSQGIARRYFVVNGFDGALTMLGLIIGFSLSAETELSVVINACLGAAIALGMSGVSSAYISESAERKHALGKLELAMVSDLHDSAHGKAARWVPCVIALINGLAPLIISLLIIMPLWLSNTGFRLPLPPLYASVMVAFTLVFLLGVFLGRVSDISWLRSGVQTLLMAILTIGLIYMLVGG